MYRIFFGLSFLIVLFNVFVFGQELYITEFQAANSQTIKDEHNEFDDWIELYNDSDSTFDLTGLYISDDFDNLKKWQFPDTRSDSLSADSLKIPPKSYKILWADDQVYQGLTHIAFKLSNTNEQIILSAGDTLSIIDFVEYDQQYPDISFGRHPDSMEQWYYFDEPSPGFQNSEQFFTERNSVPVISMQSGYYNAPIYLEMACDDINSVILYTRDASIPTDSNAIVYQGPIEITSTTVIRAVTKKSGYLNSKAVTRSFIFEEPPGLPTVYLVTDSINMWGPTGIYTHRRDGAEKPVNFEFYDQNAGEHYSSDAGIRIHAPDTRAQQSFRLYAKSIYGDNYFNYKFFSQKNLAKFKRLILRNGGNDGLQISKRSNIRDLLSQTLYFERDRQNAIAAFQIVNVYINGAYWGIYNLRERQDEYYIQENYPYEGELDMLERAFDAPLNRYTLSGDWTAYDEMRTFLDEQDLSQDENYEYISQLMDIDDFAEYWIFEVFAGNFDWLSNNMRFWKVKNSESKWRWILWDTDHGFGLPLQSYGEPDWNTLNWSMSTTGERTGGGSNNIIIRNLIKNEKFKIKFINLFADLLNSSFTVSNINRVVNTLAGQLSADVEKGIKRWGKNSLDQWQQAVQSIKDYSIARPPYVRNHIIHEFNLAGSYTMNLSLNIETSGKLKVNTLWIDPKDWQGIYFKDIPVPVTYKANKGYKFEYWTRNDSVYSDDTIFVVNSDSVVCHFVADTIPEVVISEINYHSSDAFDTDDWIELYNPKVFDLDISGWQIKDDDDDHVYTFPAHTIIDSNSYLVVCSDLEDFNELFPDLSNAYGDLAFNLDNKSDQIRIYRSNGKRVDSVAYKDEYPWPEGADGTGFTLELKDINLDNSLAQNWQISGRSGGTPGEQNDIISAISMQTANLPGEFGLTQNYPNPFNALTHFNFTVPYKAKIKIVVYNSQGQIVGKLLEDYYSPGNYSASWNAEEISSGIYFIQLFTQKSVITIKSLLIK